MRRLFLALGILSAFPSASFAQAGASAPIPQLRDLGDFTAFQRQCAATSLPSCALLRGPGDDKLASLGLVGRPASGGTEGWNAYAIPSLKPTAVFGMPNGNFVLRSSNSSEPASSAGLILNLDSTHPDKERGHTLFQVIGSQTFGLQHAYPQGVQATRDMRHANRDNLNLAHFVAQSKNAQIGATLGVTCSNEGEGDCILEDFNGEGSGYQDGDQEGTQIWRGGVTSRISRWTASLTAPSERDPSTGLTRLSTNAGNTNGLGVWNTILNLDPRFIYSAGNIARIDRTTFAGSTWMTATADAEGDFLKHYGASIILPITTADQIRGVVAGESVPQPVVTTIGVPSTAGLPASGVATLVDLSVYEPGVPFKVVDGTHVTVKTFGDHGTGTLFSFGAGTGIGLQMDADVIPANSDWGNGKTPLRVRFVPIIGITSRGEALLWGGVRSASWNTKALPRNTVPSFPVTLHVSGGSVTGGEIAGQSGHDWEGAGSNLALMPTPAVTFSAGCDAKAHVSYYRRAEGVFAGSPRTAESGPGGSPSLIIDTPGSHCVGATASLQTSYDNHYKIYEIASVPAMTFEISSRGEPTLTAAHLWVQLQNPAHWAAGTPMVAEVNSHIRVGIASIIQASNYTDYGAQGPWFPISFRGLGQGDSMMQLFMADAWSPGRGITSNEFLQRGLPVINGKQAFRHPAASALSLKGNWLAGIDMSSPNGVFGEAAAIRLDCAGFASCANLSRYDLFRMATTTRNLYDSIRYDPLARELSLTTPLRLAGLPATAGLVLDARSSAPTTSTAGSLYYDNTSNSPAACNGKACAPLALQSSVPHFAGTLTTSAGRTDRLAIAGLTKLGHCSATQTGDETSTPIAVIARVQDGSITLIHAANQPTATFDVFCQLQ